ncbi:MAG: hypothetical protein PWQ88_694 [Candidatus Methanomethylophilaceae archaeon]|nr:MAG: Amino acid-binding ACT domain protein [Methanomicrobiales archaeon 53_19]MDI3482823.1 hypothetical protein [Candidatus Methanomethylophilaceae archaeon]MDI3542215.1 hypothetical protein [Candidatus Methanomethylophilaceae archaeon]HIJ00705.1 acetolactate synthase [Candidatus Methanomethylophilaceae archaeon]
MPKRHVIKQLSIFVNNEPGRLAKIARIMKEEGIDIYAFNIAEASGFGVFRAIVRDPDIAFQKLKDRDLVVKETEVIAIPMEDRPGGLFEAAAVLGEVGINIEYGYAYSGKEGAIFFIRVNDTESAINTLLNHGIRLLKEGDL